MIERHDVYMFIRELRKLKLDYKSTSNDNLKAYIKEDILFLENILSPDQPSSK
ncbi:hypothetical protein [Alkalicoccobacillus murimartini]|uniref:Uncharacterized protein n=1 Tax=Alkalicoccobacillus murimartini TaxID=171685 RepID=A0ABT9YFE1_9BACI|nr:hypothetical protein [Alkalicoccobacillus murimartini]MDQ0206560.1 hypothetical protein [Alkalicoccobacillus murimartini]